MLALTTMDETARKALAHDMRNYLAVVLSGLQTLQDTTAAHDHPEALADAIEGARHLAVAIDRLDNRGDDDQTELAGKPH